MRQIRDTTVVIPAAGRVPEGILALSNVGSPAMIPAAGRPVIHWTMTYLRSLGVEHFKIAVPRRGTYLEDFVECSFAGSADIEFVVPSRDGGVGLTVHELVRRVDTPATLVVLGDTHFRFEEPDVLTRAEPCVLVERVSESYRWCLVETDSEGRLYRLRDKEPAIEGELDALIGVYFFPDTELVRWATAAAVGTAGDDGRVELAEILERVNAQTPIRIARAAEWLDVGNPDSQARSHQKLLQARAFNELEIDPTFGTITKRSRHTEKFIDEINYLRLLPERLAALFPRVLGFSTAWEDPYLTTEYYGYPSLAEVFVFENVHPVVWERIFEHLLEVVETGFMATKRPLPAGALQQVYLDKTRARLSAVREDEPLRAIIQEKGRLTINGKLVRNIGAVWGAIEQGVAALESTVQGCVIHGDLCLSNILYDLRSRIMKLIDPRGSFGTAGVYGDIRYDVAKLFHSVYGGYDFIVNDLFRVEASGARLDLEIRSRPQHADILSRFEAVFFSRFDRREVLLITALLFASMLPLHYDHPRRQLAMYTRSLQLLDEYLEG